MLQKRYNAAFTCIRAMRWNRLQGSSGLVRCNSTAAAATDTPTASMTSVNKPIEEEEDQLIVDPASMSEEEFASTIISNRSMYPAYQHPKTHGIPVALIHFRSFYPEQLELATFFVTHVAAALAVPCSRPAFLPTQRSLWTVIRGPFAHKKSQENFDRKTHKRCIKAWDADREVVDRWLQYVQNHPVVGVSMTITRWYRVPLGFGRELEVGDSMKKKHRSSQNKIEEMAALIIERETAAANEAAEKFPDIGANSTPTSSQQEEKV